MSGKGSPFAVGRPSRMTREEFVAAFGGCFENAAWAAERAWDAGLDASCDSPEGLLEALARQVDQASREEQDALLRGHPELATERLEELTPDSLREQRGAGLVKMGDGSRLRFALGNHLYREKFGFPFIVAVGGLRRRDIQLALVRRLEGDDHEAERARALAETKNIARARLERAAGAGAGAGL